MNSCFVVKKLSWHNAKTFTKKWYLCSRNLSEIKAVKIN